MFYYSEYRRFLKPCDIKKVQEKYLLNILKKNRNTVYGKKYNFDKIRNYDDFIKNVPLTVYEDYEPYIDAMADRKRNILTSEKIRLFELTSGSSGGKKMIPYTKTLSREFLCGIKPWLYDMGKSIKGVSEGKSYWSITPVTEGKTFTKGGIAVGFEEDSEYFGAVVRFIMNRIFAVDGSVKFSENMQDFYFKTASALVNCSELSLISVWNPTFLTILCEFIVENAEKLADTMPVKCRKNFLESASQKRFDKVFPKLSVISCWADGSASDFVPQLSEMFPGVVIQPKGILATECFISFPLCGEEGSRLSIYSHFFEFMNIENGSLVTADRLVEGEYEVIVTTGGGFYRYRIGDIVKVLKVFENRPPLVKFLGRRGISVDMFGEKLTEEFVREVCIKLNITGCFCMLAPDEKRYCLYTDSGSVSASELDLLLCESYHYNYCRKLGQLKKATVRKVSGNPAKAYIERLTSEGMRAGDIKPAYLSSKKNWDKYFEIREE